MKIQLRAAARLLAAAASDKDFIRFKCPGFDRDKDEKKVQKAILKLVDKKAREFAGVPISSLFIRPNGNFNLYDGAYFKGTDNKVYSFIGVDTENWKGFSVKITRLPDAQAKKIPANQIRVGEVHPLAK